ncbi:MULTISPECIES: addiction module protein [unclassified Nostoc]|uniref:addiction module protein n=1 Tax=unclassified Nostoc TaxID=2593658 RepID=UPI002AD2D713|nr:MULTISPECIES: addiction module protein [unclassified Nostoc]MDZ8123232.1 addiction module protein [Nostoc sp. CmiVER01]MDZ8227931.1 addiction module protein [Nostoc sp. ChiVER01]
MNPVFPELSSLSRAAKVQLVEDLWNEIAATPATLLVLDWQKKELGDRKVEYQQNSAIGSSWEDVKAKISQRHG